MFLDTSGLMCLFDRRDTRHSNAKRIYESVGIRLSHNYVLAEFVGLIVARRAPKTQALQFIDVIARSSEVEVVWVDRELHDRAMSFLIQRPDKAWSLCDALSFVIMSEKNELEALTTDRDFEQAGFVRLLEQ